jgi:hypothetical protein
MKAVRKFTTFEELKSCESKTMKDASSLKKHNDFEKVIMDIRSVVVEQTKAKPGQIKN